MSLLLVIRIQRHLRQVRNVRVLHTFAIQVIVRITNYYQVRKRKAFTNLINVRKCIPWAAGDKAHL